MFIKKINPTIKVKLLAFVLCCLVFLNFSPLEAPVVQKTDVSNAEWKKIPAGLLVWGRSASGGIEVDLYDRNLKCIATYSKTAMGFSANAIELFYCGNYYCEFILQNSNKKQNIFIRLDFNLNELLISPIISENKKEKKDSIFILSHQHLAATKTNYRLDSLEWEIRNDTVRDVNGKKILKTFLRMNSEIGKGSFPSFKTKWKFELESSVFEYTKIILQKNDKIYFYVNFNTKAGEQYIYCLKTSDGSLLYRTKLNVEGTIACVYSNYYYAQNDYLFIGRTCLLPQSDRPGIFVACLNTEGKITASKLDDGIFVLYGKWTPKYAGQSGGFGMRNALTYSKFVSMVPRPDGTFQIFIECFSLIYNIGPSNNTQSTLQDSDFHYLLLKNNPLKLSANSIQPACIECGTYITPTYTGSKNFNGVLNCNISETKIIDQHYPDNINLLTDCDAGNNYFIESIYDDQSKGNLVLMNFNVQSGSSIYELFYKTYFKGSKIDFSLEPLPISGQDLKIQAQFFIRDVKTLYKFTTIKDSYSLEFANW